jgi:hypothetical protein
MKKRHTNFISLCYCCHCHWDNFLRTEELLWVTSNSCEAVLGLPAGHCHFTFIIWPFRLQCGHRQLGFVHFNCPFFIPLILSVVSRTFLELKTSNKECTLKNGSTYPCWKFLKQCTCFYTAEFRIHFFQCVCFHCMF